MVERVIYSFSICPPCAVTVDSTASDVSFDGYFLSLSYIVLADRPAYSCLAFP